jgi:hypothetical protein
MLFRKTSLFLLILIGLLASLLIGCTPPGKDIIVDLSFTEPPLLNKPVKTIEKFTLRNNYYSSVSHNITARIKLPDGFEKEDGNLEWNGTMSRGETKSLTAIVKSTRLGRFQIEANAGWLVANPNGVGGVKTLFITVAENEATVSDKIPTGNFAWASPIGSQPPNPYAKPMTTIPPIKPIEPWQIPTPTVPSPSAMPSKAPVLPTEYLKDPLNDLIVAADCIVSGNVTAQRYETVPQNNTKAAYTIFTLSVEKMIKGDSNLKELYIKVPGGLFNDGINSPVFAGPTGVYFRVGDKVLITLHKEMDNIFVPEYGPKTTGGSFPIDNPTNAIIWIKGTDVSTQATLDQAIGRVIQIMRANQIQIVLPPDQWPPLPVGPVTRPAK